jgi:thiol-disulfide isomerase/thioredoxin
LESLEDRALLSTFSVLNTNDSGPGSLRQAILDANARPGMNTIGFHIVSGAQTIHVGSDGFGGLPFITSPVILDGTTQPGFAGSPLIELDGTNAGPTDGLDILAGNSTVRALVINRFQGSAVALYYTGSGSRIEGNYLGTDLTGAVALGNGVDGVTIYGSTGNMIGGTTPAGRNILSGNLDAGVGDLGGSGNVVAGNYIGTDVSGSQRLGNFHGVDVSNATGERIGGPGPFESNIISANGVGIDVYAGSTRTVVLGNYIGTDAGGSAPLGNRLTGVVIEDGAWNNQIGTGAANGGGNVISANGRGGVLIHGSGVSFNTVVGNLIGTDVTGSRSLPNADVGVGIYQGADRNMVGEVFEGRTARPAGNLIASNNGPGVWLASGYNSVEYNTIANNLGAGVAVSAFLPRKGTTPPIGFLPGYVAPDFTLKDQSGQDVSLSSFAGKFVILDFCAAWCDPCQQTAQRIPEVVQRLKDLNIPFEYVTVLFQNSDFEPATLADAQAWAKQFQLSSPVLWGPSAEAIFNSWGSGFIPTLVFLNPDRTNYLETIGELPVDQQVNLVSAQANDTTTGNASNSILFDAICGNGGVGIDLNNDGVTANTPGIHSRGPNFWQSYPVLTSVGALGSNQIVSGYLDSTPNMTFTIQFFANSASDASGHGQGQYFLGSTQVTTDADGHATMMFTSRPIDGAPFVCATATDSNGNTSEFSSNTTRVRTSAPVAAPIAAGAFNNPQTKLETAQSGAVVPPASDTRSVSKLVENVPQAVLTRAQRGVNKRFSLRGSEESRLQVDPLDAEGADVPFLS